MATWRYIKGSEKDFQGAPDWAKMKCYCSLDKKPNDDIAWCEGVFKSASWKALSNGSQLQKMEYPEQWFAIAQRERVTSVNDDRLARDFGVDQLIAESGSKYHREIKPGVWVDVYDVLVAWGVTNPALQHLIKKALQPGERGHKDVEQDLQDILHSAKRAIELNGVKK